MASDVLKGSVYNSLSGLSYEQRNQVIFALSGGDYEAIRVATLAMKGIKRQSAQTEGSLKNEKARAAEDLIHASMRKRQREYNNHPLVRIPYLISSFSRMHALPAIIGGAVITGKARRNGVAMKYSKQAQADPFWVVEGS